MFVFKPAWIVRCFLRCVFWSSAFNTVLLAKANELFQSASCVHWQLRQTEMEHKSITAKKQTKQKNKTVTGNDYFCGRKRPHLPQICPSWVSRTRLWYPAVHWASVLQISWNVGKIYVNKSSTYFREIMPVCSESKSAVPLWGVFFFQSENLNQSVSYCFTLNFCTHSNTSIVNPVKVIFQWRHWQQTKVLSGIVITMK